MKAANYRSIAPTVLDMFKNSLDNFSVSATNRFKPVGGFPLADPGEFVGQLSYRAAPSDLNGNIGRKVLMFIRVGLSAPPIIVNVGEQLDLNTRQGVWCLWYIADLTYGFDSSDLPLTFLFALSGAP